MNLPIPRSLLHPILQYGALIGRHARTAAGWSSAALMRLLLAFVALGSMASAQAQVNNAEFVSQSVPTTMITGQDYHVSVTMRNSGTTTWASGTEYKLGSQNPADNITWRSTNRVELTSTVAPGQQYTFNFTVTAPAAAGSYNFQWRMLREYIEWFGAATPDVAITVTVTTPPPVEGAAFVTQSVPATMVAGQSYIVSVTMKNTGNTTWTSAANYKLGSQNPADNVTWRSTNRVELTSPVAPGQQHTFNFSVTAPAAGGSYNFQWRMLREYIEWFGASTPNVAITVTALAPVEGAAFVTQSVPATMVAGQSYIVAVTMKNVGNTTWTSAANYKLGSQNSTDNFTWRSTNRVELSSTVALGQNYTFSFTVTAPTAPGTYNFQWKMVREFITWFGAPSTNVAVIVNGSTTPPSVAAVTYFHNDASGTPMLATNASGAVLWKETYRPYGERINRSAASANNALWFTGKPHDDNTGLSYMGARYYDPLLGRFVGVDPADFDPENVHSFNRYTYANNNPYKFVDPDGHSPIDVAFLVYDIGKLGVAVYTGVGVSAAIFDVGASLIGVGSPVPFAGQAMKAARAVDKGVDMARAARSVGEAASKVDRSGRQQRLRELGADDLMSSADRGWIKQEMNSIERGKRATIRNPPGKDLAHERGREASKGYSYEQSNLQDRDLHRLQHKHDDFGRANKERPVEQPFIRVMSGWEWHF